MNAERLHALVNKIDLELAETSAVEKLDALAAALEAVVTDSTPEDQQQLATSLEEFREDLAATGIPHWSPAWRDLLVEINADQILGNRLRERIDTILSTNAITPAVAKKQIDEIQAELKKLSDAVTSIQTGFVTLKIGEEELAPGDCEVGFLIPRKAVDNELGGLAAELKELDFILRIISEVATGKVEPVKIRTISSSEFLIMLQQHSGEAALFAMVLERLIAGYQKILQIRKLHGELSKLVEPKALKDVARQAEAIMVKEIKATANQAIKQYPTKDEGRKNELRTALDAVLRKLADRIDRGFNVEIRIEPLAAPDDPASTTKPDPGKVKRHEEYRAIIERAAKQLEFSYQGGTPILHLSESKAIDQPDKPDKPKRRRKKKAEPPAA